MAAMGPAVVVAVAVEGVVMMVVVEAMVATVAVQQEAVTEVVGGTQHPRRTPILARYLVIGEAHRVLAFAQSELRALYRRDPVRVRFCQRTCIR